MVSAESIVYDIPAGEVLSDGSETPPPVNPPSDGGSTSRSSGGSYVVRNIIPVVNETIIEEPVVEVVENITEEVIVEEPVVEINETIDNTTIEVFTPEEDKPIDKKNVALGGLIFAELICIVLTERYGRK